MARRKSSKRTVKKKRKTKKPRYHGRTIKTKKGGTIKTRSGWETAFVRHLEDDPNVVSFEYEPFKIPYTFRKSVKNYIPDFIVHYADGSSEIIEIKPKRRVSSPKNQAKIQAAKDLYEDFKVITEDNLKDILKRYRRK